MERFAYVHGRHLQGKKGGGDNWDIKIFNATNCERRRREATLGGGGGSDFCFLSSSVYCTCSEYLNIGRE